MRLLEFDFKILLKWLLVIIIAGFCIGALSSLFLYLLQLFTDYRNNNNNIIYFLPLCGFFIGYMYWKYGKETEKGNNLILEEYHKPIKKIPFKMAPFIFVGTLLTHLFGGSSGREGTAVQMGSAISDFFFDFLSLKKFRKLLLVIGVSAGFASVFGTPLTGAIFSIEFFRDKRTPAYFLFPALLIAFWSDFVTGTIFSTPHTQYFINEKLNIDGINWLLFGVASAFFGLAALLFIHLKISFIKLFSKIKYPPLRPIISAIVLVFIFQFIDPNTFAGLGVDVIQKSFTETSGHYDFLLKIILTTLTISSGFKGGEVTPLFFIGATLGSVLTLILPLPLSFMAAMGFVAVFSGATKTPVACSIMGMEMFGLEYGFFFIFACVIAYIFSGPISVYSSQRPLYSFKKR